MMLENIVRHQAMGKSARRAARDGANEITFAALAATVAIAAIFVPVVFMEGVVGRFFFQYGVTVTVAVFLSLLEALTLTPMRTAQFGGSSVQTEHSGWALTRWVDKLMDQWAHAYQVSLGWALRWRWLMLLASALMFLASLALVQPMRKELIPEQDQALFLVTLKAPVGTSITATSDSYFKPAENYLSHRPDVIEYFSTIGGYEGNDIVNAGVIYVTLTGKKLRKKSQTEIMIEVRSDLQNKFLDADVFVQSFSQTGFTASRGFPIEFYLQGPKWSELSKLGVDILNKLKSNPNLVDVNTDYQEDMPEIQIIPDRLAAGHLGVSVSTIGNALGNMVGGVTLDSSTQYPKDGHRYDITVRSRSQEHEKISDVLNLPLRNNLGSAGESIPLHRVAHIREAKALQLISRFNRERAIPFYANVSPESSQQLALEEISRMAKDLPPGYHFAFSGGAQTFTASFVGLFFALILGIVVAYMILASQFNSFIHPISVLLALPFSVSGAVVALFAMGQSINLFSLIGLILLMGIVKKNSILLVDFTNHKRRSAQPLPPREALLAACPVRLRPILMTSFATIAGAVPAALALGPGAETRVPMAITIIGGVSVSTLLSLYVVPCAYLAMSVLERPSAVDFDKEDEKSQQPVAV